jgi:hypothetical protein
MTMTSLAKWDAVEAKTHRTRACIRRIIPPALPGEPRPFPFEPVIELCSEGRLTGKQRMGRIDAGEPLRAEGEIARTVEVLALTDSNYVYRWLKSGLTAAQADVIGITFGLHPCLIWPDWFAHAPSEDEPLPFDQPVAQRPADRRILELRTEGLNRRDIAKRLTEERYLTPLMGRIWTLSSVGNRIAAMRRPVAV